jgi:hypothetical protein
MATEYDDWGKDPSVRQMRRIFSAIEVRYNALLIALDINPMDQKVGQWRTKTLKMFERMWAYGSHSGMFRTEKDMADLYIHCLGNVLTSDGVPVSQDLLPTNHEVEKLVKENK